MLAQPRKRNPKQNQWKIIKNGRSKLPYNVNRHKVEDITMVPRVKNNLERISKFLDTNHVKYTKSECKFEFMISDEFKNKIAIITDFNKPSYRQKDITERVDKYINTNTKVIIVILSDDIIHIEKIYREVEQNIIDSNQSILYFSNNIKHLNLINHYKTTLKNGEYNIKYEFKRET